jgi:hypothetical protein
MFIVVTQGEILASSGRPSFYQTESVLELQAAHVL